MLVRARDSRHKARAANSPPKDVIHNCGFKGGAGAISPSCGTCETRRRRLPSFPHTRSRGVWKASYQGSMIGFMNERVHPGLSTDGSHTRIDPTQELLSQPDSLTLVPDVSLRNIEFGFRRNNQFNGHTGGELFASPRPRKARKPGCSVSANDEQELTGRGET